MFEESPRITYVGNMVFLRVCPKCGRFVTPFSEIRTNWDGDYMSQINATCKKCGEVEMPYTTEVVCGQLPKP